MATVIETIHPLQVVIRPETDLPSKTTEEAYFDLIKYALNTATDPIKKLVDAVEVGSVGKVINAELSMFGKVIEWGASYSKAVENGADVYKATSIATGHVFAASTLDAAIMLVFEETLIGAAALITGEVIILTLPLTITIAILGGAVVFVTNSWFEPSVEQVGNFFGNAYDSIFGLGSNTAENLGLSAEAIQKDGAKVTVGQDSYTVKDGTNLVDVIKNAGWVNPDGSANIDGFIASSPENSYLSGYLFYDDSPFYLSQPDDTIRLTSPDGGYGQSITLQQLGVPVDLSFPIAYDLTNKDITLNQGIDANGSQFDTYITPNGTLITDTAILNPTDFSLTLQRVKVFSSNGTNDGTVTEISQLDENGSVLGDPTVSIKWNNELFNAQDIGSNLGSTLAQTIAGKNVFAGIGADALGSTIMGEVFNTTNNVGHSLLGNSIDPNALAGESQIQYIIEHSLDDISGKFTQNLTNQGYLTLSALLISEAAQELHLSGFEGKVVTAAGNTIKSQLWVNIKDPNFSFDANSLTKGFDSSSIINSFGVNLGSVLGSQLANKLVNPDSIGDALLTSLGGSVLSYEGGAIGIAAAQSLASCLTSNTIEATIGTAIGDVVAESGIGTLLGSALSNLILPGIGSLIGVVVGKVAGDAIFTLLDDITGGGLSGFFGGHPYDYVSDKYDPTTNTIVVAGEGSHDTTAQLRQGTYVINNAAMQTINTMIKDIGGKVDVLKYSVSTQFGYHHGDSPYGNDQYQVIIHPGSYISANGDSAKLVRIGVENELYHIRFSDGDLVKVRALAAWQALASDLSTTNSPPPIRPIAGLVITRIDSSNTGLGTGDTLPCLQSYMQIAEDYRNYLDHTEVINTLMAAEPNSAFSIGWLSTLLQAQAMGLNKTYTAGTFTSQDDVSGTEGNDIYLTADGGDQVYGLGGDDLIKTYGGNDTIEGGGGADSIDGGDGFDVAFFKNSPSAVTVNLLTNVNTGGDAEADSLSNIEAIEGSAFDDELTGDDKNNTLKGSGGNDVLNGGGGSDILWGNEGNNTLIGGGGEDSYHHDSITAKDTIINGFVSDGSVVAGELYMDGANSNDLSFHKDGNDLVINVDGSPDCEVNVKDWFKNVFSQLASVSTDYVSISNLDINKMLDEPPLVATQILSQATTEAAEFNFNIPTDTFVVSNPGDTLSYDVTLVDGTPLPNWLHFDAKTKQLFGMPGAADIGSINVRVIVTTTYDQQSFDDFTLTVSNINDPPSGADKTITFFEDNSYTLTVNDFGLSDPLDASANSLLAVKINDLPSNGVLSLDGIPIISGQYVSVADINAEKLKYIPDTNGNGSSFSIFTFQVQDDGGTADGGIDIDQTPNSIAFNVQEVNDLPSATNNTVTLNENSGYIFSASDFGYTDIENSPLSSVKITSLPSAGSLTLGSTAVALNQVIPAASLSTLTFSPAANANGTSYASFNFTVNDGSLDSVTANAISFNVTAVNDAPVAVNTLIGGKLPDVLFGSKGSDLMFGGDSNDKIYGNKGSDKLYGGQGNDKIYGGDGRDLIFGGFGKDVLVGGIGNDTLIGASGDDILVGGGGVDVLNGGDGSDVFKFIGISGTNQDIIIGFNASQNDIIDLSKIDANTATVRNDVFTTLNIVDVFAGTFAHPGELYFDKIKHELYGNTDSDPEADFSILLTGTANITSADLIL